MWKSICKITSITLWSQSPFFKNTVYIIVWEWSDGWQKECAQNSQLLAILCAFVTGHLHALPLEHTASNPSRPQDGRPLVRGCTHVRCSISHPVRWWGTPCPRLLTSPPKRLVSFWDGLAGVWGSPRSLAVRTVGNQPARAHPRPLQCSSLNATFINFLNTMD